jgi:hypothetical protein
MRAVGTLFGGPPIVRHFDVSANVPAGGGAVGDVACYDQSAGLIDVGDYNDSTWLASSNNDQLDDDKFPGRYPAPGLWSAGASSTVPTWLAVDGDSIAGILMGTVTASQTASAPVACFGPYNVFEANLTSWVDGDTPPTALTSLVSHLGRFMYIAAVDPAINYTYTDDDGTNFTQVTPNGIWVLSDVAATGTTALIAKILKIGYGVPGASLRQTDGVIGDKNVRVQFTVTGPTFIQ